MTGTNGPRHHRRSIRLRGYDYRRPGAYFVTICTQGRVCLLGDVIDGVVQLKEAGRIVTNTWADLPNHYAHMTGDAFIIMPNHVHAIVVLHSTGADGNVGAGLKPAPTSHGLPEIARALKTFSARRINLARATPGAPVWQRNYYEHIIRDDESLNRIRRYIQDNPQRWAVDHEHRIIAG